jgi:hypothetical protein
MKTPRPVTMLEHPMEIDGKKVIISPYDFPELLSSVGSFGKHEIEREAACLIRFFRIMGGWQTFTFDHYAFVGRTKGVNERATLYGLFGPYYDDSGLGNIMQPAEVYIIQYVDGKLQITEEFLRNCYLQQNTPLLAQQ